MNTDPVIKLYLETAIKQIHLKCPKGFLQCSFHLFDQITVDLWQEITPILKNNMATAANTIEKQKHLFALFQIDPFSWTFDIYIYIHMLFFSLCPFHDAKPAKLGSLGRNPRTWTNISDTSLNSTSTNKAPEQRHATKITWNLKSCLNNCSKLSLRWDTYSIYFKSDLWTYLNIPCSIPLTRCPDEAKVEPLLDFP